MAEPQLLINRLSENKQNMTELKAKKILLPNLVLTVVCDRDNPKKLLRNLVMPGAKNRTVYYSSPDPNGFNSYNLFPVVIDANGIPWAEANIYLLARIAGTHAPNMSTYHTIADDLAAYLRFLEEEDLQFSAFPSNKLYRPTYRYRAFLIRSVHADEVAPSTARRRIASIVSFYRWLIDEKILTPNFPPWQESDRYLRIKDNYGFSHTTKIKTTDVAIKVSEQNDPYAGTINDGGKLQPLLPAEQIWLMHTLRTLRNTEMTLIHLIALTTGARIQTILTLRLKDVHEASVTDRDVRVLVGPGTGIDTKGSKRYPLFFPQWLYEKLHVYAFSERAKTRRCRAHGGNTEDQYLFLSIRGAPLYESKMDTQIFKTDNKIRYAKKGQGVRQFIRQYVIPSIRKNFNAPGFNYRFHDLRATFGMNLTDHQLSLVELKKTTLHQAREFVKHRMGHANATTTDLYLRYRSNLHIVRWAQDGYEMHLKELIEGTSK